MLICIYVSRIKDNKVLCVAYIIYLYVGSLEESESEYLKILDKLKLMNVQIV